MDVWVNLWFKMLIHRNQVRISQYVTVNKLISGCNSFDEIFMNGKYEMSALCMLLNFGGYNIMQENILGIREENQVSFDK